jgi:subtilase family serine protease
VRVEGRFRFAVACLYVTVLLSLPGFAETSPNSKCSPMAVARITAAVDDRALTTLHGNVHPLARAEYDQGRVDDNLPLEHIIMLLQRSPEQEKALTTRIDQMHNRRSPYYHQWLSAPDVGGCYGVADPDTAIVIGWLQSHGFRIDSVPAGKMLIVFSGTAGQVRNTFHSEIHNLNVRGEQHIANMSQPQIPAALAPVITGIRSLHNFFSKPNIHILGPVKRDSSTGKWQPLEPGNSIRLNRKGSNANYTFSNGGQTSFAVGPQDLYTIYNETPLLTASTPTNGAGQTLAVIERNDITQSDVTTFRSAFGLSTYPATPDATQGGINYLDGITGYCTDPGLANTDDQGEASLDIEWIGVTAPNAIIDYVSCQSTITTDGTDLSLTYVINNLAGSVSAMSSSYGGCEPAGGSSEDAFYTGLFGQAVAEGQTVVVAAGDSGSDACDRGNGDGPNAGQDLGETGLSVQSQSSSLYAVAAGGSDFSDIYQTNFDPTSYWSATNGMGLSSALSYIPEMAWNNTCSDTVLVDYISYADSITYSNGPEGLCNDTVDAATFGETYPFTTLGGGTGGVSQFISLPTWQSVYGIGLSGNFTSTTNRNLPDISLYAAIGVWPHFLLFCDSATATCDFSNGADAQALGVGGTSAVAPMLTGIIGLINQAWPSSNPAQPTRQGQANYTFYALATAEYGTPTTENVSTTLPSVYTCEGSNINAISTYSSTFPSCTFYDINRTSRVGSSTCVGGANTGCLVDNNGGACATGTPGCYTNTPGDNYGILSLSTTSFESAFSQSAGYNAATGLGSVNIANLVANWTSFTPLFPSTTTMAVSSASIFSTTSTTLTATVTATGRGGIAPPLGTVSVYSGSSCTGTAVATAPLVPATGCTTSCNASASLPGITGAQLGVGADSVVACFSGDGANDAPSTSSAASVTVVQTALTVAPTPSSLSIVGGQKGTVALAVSANAAIPTAITLACTGLPSDASCTFSSFTTLPATVTMTIATTAADAKLIFPREHRSSWLMLGLLLPGILLLPAGAAAIRRRRNCLWCGLTLLLIVGWLGCGGSSSSTTTPPPPTSQNYTVTVTGSATNATSGPANVTVTVTQ